MVRMRLWSLFCGGNKTSDVPQLPNNYLCSKALQREQQTPRLRNESTTKACGGVKQERIGTHRFDRLGNRCPGRSLLPLQFLLRDCPAHVRQNAPQANCARCPLSADSSQVQCLKLPNGEHAFDRTHTT